MPRFRPENLSNFLRVLGEGGIHLGGMIERRRERERLQKERLYEKLLASEEKKTVGDRKMLERSIIQEEKETEHRRKRSEKLADARTEFDRAQTSKAISAESKSREDSAKAIDTVDKRYSLWIRGEYKPKTEREKQLFDFRFQKETTAKPEKSTEPTVNDMFNKWKSLDEQERGLILQEMEDAGEQASDYLDFPTFQRYYRMFILNDQSGGQNQQPINQPQPRQPASTGNPSLDYLNAASGSTPVFSPADTLPAVQLPGQMQPNGSGAIFQQDTMGMTGNRDIRQRAKQIASSIEGFDGLSTTQQQLLIDYKMRELLETAGAN